MGLHDISDHTLLEFALALTIVGATISVAAMTVYLKRLKKEEPDVINPHKDCTTCRIIEAAFDFNLDGDEVHKKIDELLASTKTKTFHESFERNSRKPKTVSILQYANKKAYKAPPW